MLVRYPQLEDKETIDDKLMAEIASALKVPVDAIDFNEEKAINNISCTFQYFYDNASALQFNPVEKIATLYDEKVELLERLLQSEKEKVEIL